VFRTDIESEMCRVDERSFCNDFVAEYSSSGLSINRGTCKNTLCNECGAPAGRANRVVVTDCGSWYAAAFAVRGRPSTGGLKLVPPGGGSFEDRRSKTTRPVGRMKLAENPLRLPSPVRWTVITDSFSKD
jgi:hypothetical protein